MEDQRRSLVEAGAALNVVLGGTVVRHARLPQSSRITCTGVMPSLLTKCSVSHVLPYAPGTSGALIGKRTRSNSRVCATAVKGRKIRARTRPHRLSMCAPTLRFVIRIWCYSMQHRGPDRQI